MQYLKYIGLLLYGSLIFSCAHDHEHEGHNHDEQGHDHSDHNHGEDAHNHEHEENLLKYNRFSSNTELYLEFEPLVKGKKRSILIHANDLTNFAPLKVGKLKLALLEQGTVIANTQASKSADGVFKASLIAPKAGKFELRFIYEKSDYRDTIWLKDLQVLKSSKEHLHDAKTDPEGDIEYLKEQAWASEFATAAASRRKVGQIIHASGQFHPSISNYSSIVAKREGVVYFRKPHLCIGSTLRSGELVFEVRGEGIVEDELNMQYKQAQSIFDQTKANYERQQTLLKEQIIGEKQVEIARKEFELAEASLQRLEQLYSKGAKRQFANAPAAGYLADLLVTEGQFVEAGQPLAKLLRSTELHIEIELAPKYGNLLPKIEQATFINPYTGEAVDLKEMNGHLLSYDRVPKEESHYWTIYFEVENHPKLPAGGLVEAYLQTKEEAEILAIPKTALLEEMGNYIAFIQRSGEAFEKRVLEIGRSDGRYVEVLRGLEEGERVVSKGALRIKQASMALEEAPHGHAH
jgi:cobalt-zinc-cadmium efflux system membrane fusion protein